jgi:hypothetical protein
MHTVMVLGERQEKARFQAVTGKEQKPIKSCGIKRSLEEVGRNFAPKAIDIEVIVRGRATDIKAGVNESIIIIVGGRDRIDTEFGQG